MAVAVDAEYRVLLVQGPPAGGSLKGFALPDPRTGRPLSFLLGPDGSLHEVNRFKQEYAAWLAGDKLLADGGLFLASPVDPLFVLLPALERARDKDEACPDGKFKALDEILSDASAPALAELLPYARAAAVPGPDALVSEAPQQESQQQQHSSNAAAAVDAAMEPEVAVDAQLASGQEGASAREAAGTAACVRPSRPMGLEERLACICDVKRAGGESYFRLNDQRVLAWLLLKYRQAAAALAPHVAGMDERHVAPYVLGMLGEYVGEGALARVAAHMGASLVAAAEGAGGNGAKAAAGPASAARDGAPAALLPAARAASPAVGGPPEKKQKVDPRAASKQAAMAKQAVGTKKLTSFFVKK